MSCAVVNEATICLISNEEYPLQEEDDDEMVDNAENIQKCEDNVHCMVKKVEVDDYFDFKLCAPK